jgi:putative transposase
MAARRTGLNLPLPLQFLAAWLAVWMGRVLQEQIDYLKQENQLLQEKLGGKRIRFSDGERRRLATLAKRLGRRALAEVATVASPETILRWYRELVAKKYDGSERRGPGRPKRRGEIAELVLRMARENETWGYTRIKGALKNLGYEVARNTIKRILQEHGIDPAPDRGKRMSWATFIKAHLGEIVGMDFLTAEVVTWLGLIRYHVLFAIDIASRRVEIVGIVANPGGSDRKSVV